MTYFFQAISVNYYITLLNKKTGSFTYSAPWYTPELHQMKSCQPHLERLCQKTVHLLVYRLHSTIKRCSNHSPVYLLPTPHTLWLQQPQISLFHNKTNFSNLVTTPSSPSQLTRSPLSFFQIKMDTIYSSLITSPAFSTSPTFSVNITLKRQSAVKSNS